MLRGLQFLGIQTTNRPFFFCFTATVKNTYDTMANNIEVDPEMV
jgi:hypothetical protein